MAHIEERNGSFRITVSNGVDIYGKRIQETDEKASDALENMLVKHA